MNQNFKKARVQKTRNLPLEERMKLYEKTIFFKKNFGWSNKEIAKELGISPSTVAKWILRTRIPQRSFNIPSLIPSPELSYLIGAIKFSDGSCYKYFKKRKDRKGYFEYIAELAVVDKDFAQKVADSLPKILGKVYKVKSVQGKFRVRVYNKLLYEFLKSGNKRMVEVIEKFPESFIRGVADGDGTPHVSIYYPKKEFDINVVVSLTTDYIFLKYLQNLLLKDFGINSEIYVAWRKGEKHKLRGEIVRTKTTGYGLWIQNFQDVAKFYEFINFTIARKAMILKDAINIFENYAPQFRLEKWNSLYTKVKSGRRRWNLR